MREGISEISHRGRAFPVGSLFVCEELCLLVFCILPSCHQSEVLLLSLIWPSQTNESFLFLNHRLWELEGTPKFTRCDPLQK